MSPASGDGRDGAASRPKSGVFALASGLAATLLASGRTRLELLGNELEEEKLRAIRLLLLAQAMVFCLGVGTLLVVALLALIFWEGRLWVAGGMGALFLLLGAVFYRIFLRATQRAEPVFAASLAELEEDIRQLKAAAEAAKR